MRRSVGVLAGIGALLIAQLPLVPNAVGPRPAAAHDTSNDFVTRSGSTLMLAGQPYRFAGINMYNANSDGWCREALDNTQVGQALDNIGLGTDDHGVLRAWFFQTLATDKGTKARDWTRFDRTLQIAHDKGYKVIATLDDQWGECGTNVTPTFGYKTAAWYTAGYAAPDPSMLAAYPAWLSHRDWVTQVVDRYRDDPTILAWQLINEAEVNPDWPSACPAGNGPRDILMTWATAMSSLVRAHDSNHLISLGTIGSGQCGSQGDQYQDVNGLPNVDVCEVHDYTANRAIPGDQWNGFALRVQQCAALGKPMIVGEAGIIPTDVGQTYDDRAMSFRAKLVAQGNAGVDGFIAWDYFPGGSTIGNYDIGPGDPTLAELQAPGGTFVVNAANDVNDGACNATHCSLREAILAANSTPGRDLIAFNLPGPQPHVILTMSALPAVTEAALIDGTTEPDTAGSPTVVLNGTGAGPTTTGLTISGANVHVRGLRITGFGGSGILVTGTSDRLEINRIDSNGADGITTLSPAQFATITGNTITANGDLGIDIGDDGVTLPAVGGPVGPPPPYEAFRQNAPVLYTVDSLTGHISGEIGSLPGQYRLEFYRVTGCDPSGAGEGDTLIGTTIVDIPGSTSWGTAAVDLAVPGGIADGQVFTATATNPLGTTSEFSPCATQPGGTPTGSNIDIPVPGTTLPLDVTFQTVSGGGITTATTLITPPPLPSGYKFGTTPVFYDISTTAAYAGTVTVCLTYDDAAFADEAGARLLHWNGSTWQDITTSLDTIANILCGTTTSLSPFAVTERDYRFGRFVQPIDSLPTINDAKAGSAIPVKFSLEGGYLGLDIFRAGFPASSASTCGSAAFDTVEETVTAGSSHLEYDPLTGLYSYVWKTDKSWRGCRTLVLRFRDGTVATAAFNFRK